MEIKGSNITINVKDIEKAIAFYEAIGFKMEQQWGNHYARLSVPGTTIGLHPTSVEHLTGGSGNISIGFITDHFDEVKSFLDKLSIPSTTRQEEGGSFVHFSDPDGTALYFIKPMW